MDVKYLYLNNQMYRAEYIMIHISMIPQQFIDKYNLKYKTHNGNAFAQVTKGVYGLPKSGIISHGSLVQHLEPYGCCPSNKTPGLWTHDIHPISSTLVVDDFGVRYSGK